MGLDVRVYNNIKITEKEEYADFTAFVSSEYWKYKIKNLKEGKAYKGDSCFRGVSCACSSHNRFRETLIKLIGRDDLLDVDGKIKWNELPDDMPFYDFIDFSDCEGCLDWEISAKIYTDFEKYFDKAKLELNEYNISIYETWLETFNYGRSNSVVVFY